MNKKANIIFLILFLMIFSIGGFVFVKTNPVFAVGTDDIDSLEDLEIDPTQATDENPAVDPTQTTDESPAEDPTQATDENPAVDPTHPASEQNNNAAQDSNANPITVTIPNPLGEDTNVKDILNRVADWLFRIAIVVVPLMIIWAGFVFVTAGGDPKKVSNAKQILLYAIVGFVVILLARGIVGAIKYMIVGPA
jgi:ABC-type microcin C transport system permease subunit YejE